MASAWQSATFDHQLFRTELDELGKLLRDNSELAEQIHIQPFFKSRQHLTAYIGTIFPISVATEICYEFDLAGDYRADLVLGNREKGHFCVVEFEDGKPNAIFKKLGNRNTPEWSPRFEHAFSQIVDWFYCLEDHKKTDKFRGIFGMGEITFESLLIMGRSASLSDSAKRRLTWRSRKVLIDSNKVTCITFDELHEILSDKYKLYRDAAKFEN